MFRYNGSIPYDEKHSHDTLSIGVNFRTTSVVNLVVSPFREAGFQYNLRHIHRRASRRTRDHEITNETASSTGRVSLSPCLRRHCHREYRDFCSKFPKCIYTTC